MRIVVLIVFIAIGLGSLFAEETLKDTIRVKEVKITASRNRFFQQDFKVIQVDTLLRDVYAHEDLQSVLEFIAPVQVMNYGSEGALSGVRMRGGASSHTQVNWNGFPVNSLTTGGADISMVSFGMGDNISITYGGSGAIYGSGAMGGVIDIDHEPIFEKRVGVSGIYEGGSFSHHKSMASVLVSNKNVSFSLKSSYLNARGDFPYSDDRGRERINEHNAVQSCSLVPFLDFQTTHLGQFGIGAWYGSKRKEIPVKMNSHPDSQSSQEQRDSTLKVFGTWSKLGNGYNIKFKTGFFKDFLTYSDKNSPGDTYYKTYSEISSQRFYNDINARFFLSEKLSIDAGGQFSVLSAEVVAYGDEAIQEKDAALIVAGKFRLPWLVFNASGRLAYNSSYGTVPVFSIGGKGMIVKDLLSVRFNGGTRFRQPTFNDRYWQPYGNPDLLPEKGYNFEAGFEGNATFNRHHLKYDLSVYHSKINDWIEWAPRSDGDMAPQNNKKVRSEGLEISLSDQYTWAKGFLRIEGAYNYNQTKNMDSSSATYQQFLAYSPQHKAALTLIAAYGPWMMLSNNGVTSMRYTTENNTVYEQLPAYFISNAQVKYKLSVEQFAFRAFFKVNNLFNQNYQVVRFYQMPGRAFYVGIEINFKS